MTPTFAYLKGLITLMYYYAHFKNIEMHVNANLRIRTRTQAANLCQNSRNNWNPGCIPVGSERFFFLPLNVYVEGSEGVCKSSEQQVFFDQIVQVLVSHFQISKNRQKFSTHNMSKWNV